NGLMDPSEMACQADALFTLLEIERAAGYPSELTSVTDSLTNLLNYVAGTNVAESSVAQVLHFTYDTQKKPKNQWPPEHLAKGIDIRLDSYEAIKAGLDVFYANLGLTQKENRSVLTNYYELQVAVNRFASAETNLLAAADATNSSLAA